MTTITTVLRHYDYGSHKDVLYLVSLSKPHKAKRKRRASSWRCEIIDGPLSELEAQQRAAQAQKIKGEK